MPDPAPHLPVPAGLRICSRIRTTPEALARLVSSAEPFERMDPSLAALRGGHGLVLITDGTDLVLVEAAGGDRPRRRSPRLALCLLPLLGAAEAAALCVEGARHHPRLRIATRHQLADRCPQDRPAGRMRHHIRRPWDASSLGRRPGH